jgi:hypothetical protein
MLTCRFQQLRPIVNGSGYLVDQTLAPEARSDLSSVALGLRPFSVEVHPVVHRAKNGNHAK